MIPPGRRLGEVFLMMRLRLMGANCSRQLMFQADARDLGLQFQQFRKGVGQGRCVAGGEAF